MKPVKSLLFVIGLFAQTALFSQITIYASKTTGCDTLTVEFSYMAPFPASEVRWDFGDGQTSNLSNPV